MPSFSMAAVPVWTSATTRHSGWLLVSSKDTDQSSADEFMIVGDEEFNRDFH
jgi:hypothetical protein